MLLAFLLSSAALPQLAFERYQLQNGLTVQGINSFWQNVAQGSLLVVAVVIQQRRSGERAVGLPA